MNSPGFGESPRKTMRRVAEDEAERLVRLRRTVLDLRRELTRLVIEPGTDLSIVPKLGRRLREMERQLETDRARLDALLRDMDTVCEG
ncbi:hypothetical protein LX15_003517 [Streptoalloteichus tenebrarius]|uniref:Uncharacterized protein n=1 Tax=Streptoalloteichus tenebrarius (strain ATCC 17920 / DSM 40477 / JCM 4838 / CBS 697.72 / NBRC 16177 / NCIMB 11028 / NRRL B-12390 / A12253. 1 / ISP 5477) TaxID=1933 RepID=A0ABT1HWB9_STRSD|nr:hypothetical protein [Streptoalloteichus tenebrarius]MCP2259808.1 hypothetical protein [Streptoalloteichus tenebrarius]BFE99246.1 hypothetical protein GCM10020241_09220 [Streptoalloteichus tenebrarius]